MANETNNLQIVIETVNKATSDLSKISKELNALSNAVKKVGAETKEALTPLQKMAGNFLDMYNSGKKAMSSMGSFVNSAVSMAPKMLVIATVIGTVVAVITGLISIIRKSIDAYNEYEQTMTGLMSVSAAFGQSQSEAIEEAKRLASDGLISVSTAASGLKTIMQTGLGLPKAIELMEVYKNRAATGRGASISYDQAVRNLSETFMTENSMLGNLSGQAENYNLIMEIGAGILGKKVATLVGAERAEAKYLGTIELGKKAIGDSDRYANTYLGTISRLKNTFTMIGVEIGSYFQPILKNLAEWLERNMTVANSSVSVFKLLAYAMQALSTSVQVATDSFVGLFRVIVGGVESIKTLSLAPLLDSLYQTGETLTKDWKGYIDALKDISNIGLDEINKNMVDSFQQTSEAAEKAAKLQEDYSHSLMITNRDFKRSLEELVISHRDAYKSLKKDIASEKQEFKESLKDKKKEFDKAMASITESHSTKTKSILEDIEAEKKAYQEEVEDINEEWGTIMGLTETAGQDRLADLQAQLDKELSLGSSADQEKVVSLREMIANMNTALRDALTTQAGTRDEEIADVTETTDDKLALLREELEEENIAYEESLAERREQYDEDVANAKESYEERLEELEDKLSDEKAIREKYAEDFKNIGDKQALDDITNLINSHEEQLVEMEYQYQRSLEGLEGFEDKKTGIISDAEQEQQDIIEETNKRLSEGVRLLPEWLDSVTGSRYSGETEQNDYITPSWMNLTGMQHGGVVSQPSIVGEKGYPEVVLPLNEPQRVADILEGLGMTGSMSGGSQVVQNFNITVNNQADVDMVMERALFNARYLK